MCNEAGNGPPGGPPLDVWGEWERLTRAAHISDPESLQGIPWSMFRLTPPTRGHLVDHLSLAEQQNPVHLGYQVLHFGCHGCPQGIFLEDSLGRELFVSTADLVKTLRGHGVRLVVFNACETEQVAQELVHRKVADCAVAMRSPIYDNEAAVLAQRFYRGLAVGKTAAGALDEARRAIAERYEKGDWRLGIDLATGKPFTPEQRTANLLLLGNSSLTLSVEEPAASDPHFVHQQTPSNEPLPRYLLPSFVGRHEELYRLARWFEDTGRVTFAVSGVGGIGKSALALNAALRAAHRFKVLVWASAKDAPDFGCLQVLEKLAEAGLPPLQSNESANLAGALDHRLNEQRVLLVLDNLEELNEARCAELAQALGGIDAYRGSRVLMTLRPREKDPLTARVEAQDRLPLTVLDPTSGLRLAWEQCLARGVLEQSGPALAISPQEDAALNEAARAAWLNHVPSEWLLRPFRLAQGAFLHPKLIDLAVSMVANRGWEKTFIRLGTLTGKDLQDDLQEFIGRMVDDLVASEPAALEVLRAAVVFQGGAEEALLRTVALGRPVEEGEAEAVTWEDGPLRAAVDASLLRRLDLQGNRYDLDPPVRAYVGRFCMTYEKREELDLRHAESLVPTVEYANEYLVHGGEFSSIPEWSNLTVAWNRLTAAIERQDRRAARILVLFSQHWRNALTFKAESNRSQWLRAALSAARMLADQSAEAHTLQTLGDVQFSRGNVTRARIYYQRALRQFETIGDRHKEANTLHALGLVHMALESHEAESCLRRALHLHRLAGADVNAQLGEANVLTALGSLAQSRKEIGEAMEHYRQGLRLHRRIGNRLGEANTLRGLGLTMESTEYLQEALRLYRDLSYRSSEALIHLDFGFVLSKRNELAEALSHNQQALLICRELNDRHGEADCLTEKGRIALIRGNQHEADELLSEAVAIYRVLGDGYKVASQTGYYGQTLIEVGRSAEAEPYLLRSAELFEEEGRQDLAASVHAELESIRGQTPAHRRTAPGKEKAKAYEGEGGP